MQREGSGRRTLWLTLLTALVFLVALNLRAPITAVGPVLPQIGADLGLSETVQGLLGALPLLAFAMVSPLVHSFSQRLGAERTVLLALAVLTAGILIRSYGGSPGLWMGTLAAGGAIAVGNVLVPALIKRDYAGRISGATGLYTAGMAVTAAIASGVAVPMADAVGWKGALAFWALPALIVGALWAIRALPASPEAPAAAGGPAPVSVWRQPGAWMLTAFMGLQSTTYYTMITWLPTIEIAAGTSPEIAGAHLFAFQLIGILAALLIPRLMRRQETQAAAAVTSTSPMVVGLIGMLAVPEHALVWALLMGLSSGSSIVVALSMISFRGRTTPETTRLSGMAQSVGYLLAAGGPLLAGVLAESSGGWQVPLLFVLAVSLLQLGMAVPAGMARFSALRG